MSGGQLATLLVQVAVISLSLASIIFIIKGIIDLIRKKTWKTLILGIILLIIVILLFLGIVIAGQILSTGKPGPMLPPLE